ncbi:lipopolysaccharide biosynthesis protein [Robertkochia solimangrovi]|uniref:lipopolysaccharide biosynthesis protein n=1 Tax=Robertkochia solimangrovi TaxID=2213046 RepID=UPI00117EFF7D|nr:polysaccharide biosynthesis C-terminal domain-containing protein [Robertkochia solimangrovi]TRZ46000.1 polysaccharide biosynthesis protein [Robertkochia solimangrovi]
MSALKKLFRHTFIYGMATVLPRILGLILTPFYTSLLPESDYGIYISLMVYMILGNVVLSYGMETAFFRFVNKSERKSEVQSTALTAILISSIVFFITAMLLRNQVAFWLQYDELFIVYVIGILFLDALAVIPFAWFRNQEMSIRYSVIKILSVVINLGLNLLFFLGIPYLVSSYPDSSLVSMEPANKVHYIFLANIIASFITFLILLPLYFRIGVRLDRYLLKKMVKYAYPVLIAGVAFAINEGFDKLLLRYLLPDSIAESEVGVYGACYKLGAFMTLFVTAFKLGVEPFFFSHANKKNSKETYAAITLYFTIFGSLILLFVVVYTDLFKMLMLPDPSYWRALWVVPFILLANLCLGIYHNLSVWYKITDKTMYGAVISVIGALITLGINFMLIPVISFKGSAIATLAAYGSMMVISYYLGSKKYPIPYDLKKIGIYLGVSVLFSWLSFYVFDRDLIIGSVLLLVFLALIWVLESKNLRTMIKTRTSTTLKSR